MDTAVVTGAGDGLGASVARLFATEGVHVVAGARDADALGDLAADAAGDVTAVRTDVRDEFDLERLMERAARVGGPLDCVVAAAEARHGPRGETPLPAESYAAFDDHVRTNGRGAFATVREALPHLAADARVLVPSVPVARDPSPGTGSYAASKALAAAVARGFAADLDRTVGVLDVDPDAPEESARLVLWAATEADPGAIDGRVTGVEAWRDAK